MYYIVIVLYIYIYIYIYIILCITTYIYMYIDTDASGVLTVLADFLGDRHVTVAGQRIPLARPGCCGSFPKIGGTLFWSPYNKDPTI